MHMARHTGEFIGWSTLTGRESFSASGKCLEPTSLLKFERDRFLRILETNSENAAMLFKRLAITLGKRLVQTYPQNLPGYSQHKALASGLLIFLSETV